MKFILAQELMQSKKVNVFHEHVLVKEIGSKKRTPWHQDQTKYKDVDINGDTKL